MHPLLALLILIILTLLTLLIIHAEVTLLRVNKSPFLPTPTKVLKKVFENVKIGKDSVVYDLGCGDARVLLALSEIYPEATYIGVEKFMFPYLIARINLWLKLRSPLSKKRPQINSQRSKSVVENSVKVLYQDIKKTDFSRATHIFMFLSSDFMDDLYPVFLEKLKPGTVVVSHMFYFRKKDPINVVENTERKFFGRNFYIYKF